MHALDLIALQCAPKAHRLGLVGVVHFLDQMRSEPSWDVAEMALCDTAKLVDSERDFRELQSLLHASLVLRLCHCRERARK